MLLKDGLVLNDAAKNAEAPLNDAAAMEKLLRTAAQEHECNLSRGAFTLPLLTDALSMRSLMLMPTDDGILAVAVEQREAPINAFSSEMRESLTNIFAVLPMLATRLDDMDLRYTEEIQANCYNLLRLASNLENASRIEKKIYETRPVDLTELVKTICYCADSVCKETGIPIEWNLPKHHLPVRVDPRVLSIAILNLLRNSLQYTRDGNHITIRLSQVGARAVLTVQDKGLGIKPENVEKVFEPYFSIDPYGDTSERPGMGLGLSVVRETACGFGGTVNAESTFGEGTSITIALPVDNGSNGEDVLGSDPADYLLNRYSPVYVQLCGICRLPALNGPTPL